MIGLNGWMLFGKSLSKWHLVFPYGTCQHKLTTSIFFFRKTIGLSEHMLSNFKNSSTFTSSLRAPQLVFLARQTKTPLSPRLKGRSSLVVLNHYWASIEIASCQPWSARLGRFLLLAHLRPTQMAIYLRALQWKSDGRSFRTLRLWGCIHHTSSEWNFFVMKVLVVFRLTRFF